MEGRATCIAWRSLGDQQLSTEEEEESRERPEGFREGARYRQQTTAGVTLDLWHVRPWEMLRQTPVVRLAQGWDRTRMPRRGDRSRCSPRAVPGSLGGLGGLVARRRSSTPGDGRSHRPRSSSSLVAGPGRGEAAAGRRASNQAPSPWWWRGALPRQWRQRGSQGISSGGQRRGLVRVGWRCFLQERRDGFAGGR